VSQVPTQAAAAGAVSQPALAADDLREALLARVRPASAEACERQDAELDAEAAALEAAGECEVPSEAELAGLAPDPLAGPPDGALGWLADLPGPLLDEYTEATARPAGPEPIAAGWWSRTAGDGGGFAAGGMADDLPPGPVLAGLTADRHAAGLGRLTDDEVIGVLRAARRLETGVCAHRRESAGYRAPGSLRHLIRVRQQSCAFPGCGRPARRCDLDHTVPHDAGGRTCECNLAPTCK